MAVAIMVKVDLRNSYHDRIWIAIAQVALATVKYIKYPTYYCSCQKIWHDSTGCKKRKIVKKTHESFMLV